VGRKEDRRLEVAGNKVCGRRDVVGVRDVHVSAREGVFLRVRVSGVLHVATGIGGLTVYTPKVKYLRGGTTVRSPMSLDDCDDERLDKQS